MANDEYIDLKDVDLDGMNLAALKDMALRYGISADNTTKSKADYARVIREQMAARKERVDAAAAYQDAQVGENNANGSGLGSGESGEVSGTATVQSEPASHANAEGLGQATGGEAGSKKAAGIEPQGEPQPQIEANIHNDDTRIGDPSILPEVHEPGQDDNTGVAGETEQHEPVQSFMSATEAAIEANKTGAQGAQLREEMEAARQMQILAAFDALPDEPGDPVINIFDDAQQRTMFVGGTVQTGTHSDLQALLYDHLSALSLGEIWAMADSRGIARKDRRKDEIIEDILGFDDRKDKAQVEEQRKRQIATVPQGVALPEVIPAPEVKETSLELPVWELAFILVTQLPEHTSIVQHMKMAEQLGTSRMVRVLDSGDIQYIRKDADGVERVRTVQMPETFTVSVKEA